MQLLNDPKRLSKYIMQNNLETILPKEVFESCELTRFGRDEAILVANEPMPYFYFFVHGKLKVFQIHDNGKAFLIQFYSAFDSLGEVELLNALDASCSVDAVMPSELIRIPMSILRQYAIDYPPFLQYVARSLSTKLLVADRHHASNLLYPVKNRLASYLRAHENDNHDVLFKDSLQDVSEYIGTTYRQLHRAFQQMEEEGIIERTHKKIVILNEEKLESMAGNIYGGPF